MPPSSFLVPIKKILYIITYLTIKRLMSSFNLAKKLKPATKAWKSFKNTLQSKLPNNILKFSKSIKKIRPFIQLKLRTKTPRSFNHRRHHYHHQTQKNSAAIYVDHLFPVPTSMHPNKGEEILLPASTSGGGATNEAKVEVTNMNINKLKKEHIFTPRKGVKVLDGSWKVSSLPQIRGVDERADEFISKFRQDMKLQREQSLLDFQEMLARGA